MAPSLNFQNISNAFKHKPNKDLIRSYWLFKAMASSVISTINSNLTPWLASNFGLVRNIIKNTAFKQFCGGESIAESIGIIDSLNAAGIGTILDYSVEGEKNEKSFEETAQEIIRTIREATALGDKKIPFAVFKISGIVDAEILTARQAGVQLSAAQQSAYSNFQKRMHSIVSSAHQGQVRLFIDAEESWFQKQIDSLALELMETYNKQRPIIWNTYQFYLHPTAEVYLAHLNQAKANGFTMGAKLVRGAYMEKEAARAAELKYPNPVQPTKDATDADYDRAVETGIRNLSHISLCLGTHNEVSCQKAALLMEQLAIVPDNKSIWFAQLLGMSDNISYNLAQAGYNVAKYVPYGPVKAVLPYLMRRAKENTSIAGQSSRELTLISSELKRRKISPFVLF